MPAMRRIAHTKDWTRKICFLCRYVGSSTRHAVGFRYLPFDDLTAANDGADSANVVIMLKRVISELSGAEPKDALQARSQVSVDCLRCTWSSQFADANRPTYCTVTGNMCFARHTRSFVRFGHAWQSETSCVRFYATEFSTSAHWT